MRPCRSLPRLLAAPALLLLAVAPAWAADEAYVIGHEDVLDIQVWDNKDLNQVVFVRPDGKISLPLLGEVHAGGKTVQQLQDALTALYAKSVKDASVTVIPVNFTRLIQQGDVSQNLKLEAGDAVIAPTAGSAYVQGEVKTPKTITLSRDLTILGVISEAGGLTPLAASSRVVIIRGAGDKRERIQVDLEKFMKAPDL